jgi:hypothetical protein
MGNTRRSLLRSLGLLVSASLAGCQTTGSTPASTATTPSNSTPSSSERSPSEQTTIEPPARYQVHLVPGKNETLRSEMPSDQLKQYLQHYGTDLVTDANILSPEPDHGYQRMTVDLLAMEYWHDNDVQHIEPDEGQAFLKTLGEDSPEGSMAHEAKTNPRGARYPNSEGESNTYGHFDFEQFIETESVDEALDWLQKYLFNWEKLYDDPGPISTEDELYAAVLQQGLDQHTDIESHAWACDLPEAPRSTHGNGLIYDETNNRMHVMETITGPLTQTPGETDEQYHPPVEESNYLEEGHRAKQSWWHPLRFGQDYGKETLQNFPDLDFKTRKLYPAGLIMGVATGGHDMEATGNDTIAPTTGYLADLTDKLLNWNQDDSLDAEVFEEIKHQSKVYNLLRNHEDNFVMYGTVENPKVASVESKGLLEEVWNDQEGEYDDFDQHLESAA